MLDIFELLAKKIDPKGGLYIHLIQPKCKIEEPGKVIEAGMSVIKPGKFTGSLKGRMKSYLAPRYWHYEDGSAAFQSETTRSWLLFDATTLPREHRWLIAGLEDKLLQLLEEHFEVLGKIGKGKSEYREIRFKHLPSDIHHNLQLFDAKIHDISFEICKIISKVVSKDFYEILNCNASYFDFFYSEDFFSELDEDVKKNKSLLFRLLPNIWSWESENSLNEFQRVVRTNFGSNVDFFKEALSNDHEDSSCLLLASDLVLADRGVLLAAVKANSDHGCSATIMEIYAPEELKNDQNFLKEVLEIDIREFENIGQYITDVELVKKVLSKEGLYIKYVKSNYKNDLELIQIALNNNPNAIEFVPNNLKANIEAPFFDEWYIFKDGDIKQ